MVDFKKMRDELHAEHEITRLRAEVVRLTRERGLLVSEKGFAGYGFVTYKDHCAAVSREKARAAAAEAALAKVREGVQKVISGDYGRPRKYFYLASNQPSKHDTCIHNRFVYNDCNECVNTALRAALAQEDGN